MARSMQEKGIDSDPKFEAARPQHGIFIWGGGCGPIFFKP